MLDSISTTKSIYYVPLAHVVIYMDMSPTQPHFRKYAGHSPYRKVWKVSSIIGLLRSSSCLVCSPFVFYECDKLIKIHTPHDICFSIFPYEAHTNRLHILQGFGVIQVDGCTACTKSTHVINWDLPGGLYRERCTYNHVRRPMTRKLQNRGREMLFLEPRQNTESSAKPRVICTHCIFCARIIRGRS